MLSKYRNIIFLSIAQIFGMTGSICFTLLGALVGMKLSSSRELITLPIAILVVGAAISAIPSARLMNKVGRKRGQFIGATIAVIGSILAIISLYLSSFFLFCISALMIGINSAFVQQYRFAVIEGLSAKYTSRAVSILLFGNILSAYLGTELTSIASNLFKTLYLGSFIVLTLMLLISMISLYFYEEINEHEHTKAQKDLKIIKGNYIPAIIVAALSFAVMSLIMVGTPVAMHVLHHISLEKTTIVMQSHLIAMYLPSLFVGYFVSKIGNFYVTGIGILFLILSVIVNLTGLTFNHYLFGLIFLGLGWNFSFICATTILTESYFPRERFKKQAVNDFFVFGINATTSLLSGSIVLHFGWVFINILALFLIFIMIISMLVIYRNSYGI